ncbi:MAG: hypothetical protein IKA72_03490 [Clostridia bacterium]|nr:hypothetical protein [Clostridia bacterium]
MNKDLYIDIGSTNIKWKRAGGVSQTPFPTPVYSENGRFEVDAEEIFNIVRRLIEDSKRVFFSVQMHGYVLLKDGVAVSNYISWRDERGAAVQPAFTLTKEYGVDIKPNLPRLSLQTQTVEFDEFCTLGSYLVYRLTGKNETHISDAAPSGFYNVCLREREQTAFKLPTPSYEIKPVGHYLDTAIYTPVGDQQASILGSVGRCFDGYVLNLGTAAQLCEIANGFVSGEFESRPYFDGKTLCTVTRLIGGGVIAKYSDDEIFEKLVEEYGGALKKLPVCKRLVATGGLVKYRRTLLCKVLDELGVEYSFNEECDALAGLEILSKGEIK